MILSKNWLFHTIEKIWFSAYLYILIYDFIILLSNKCMYTYMEIVLFYFQIECPSNWPQNSAPGRSDGNRGFPCSQEYTAVMIWFCFVSMSSKLVGHSWFNSVLLNAIYRYIFFGCVSGAFDVLNWSIHTMYTVINIMTVMYLYSDKYRK